MPDSISTTPSAVPRSRFWLALVDWAHNDGSIWLYMAKVLIAAFLSLWVSMKLELEQPKTAMTTVFIVMQPQVGSVLAKSFYRICGTIVGLGVALACIGLFPQQPELFIVAIALWVGICTAGAARNRNFRSYGFLLAGYTAALIGIPASQQPDLAFTTATIRVAEVLVGIICAGFVSAIVFPSYAGDTVSSSACERFSSFMGYVASMLREPQDQQKLQLEKMNRRFMADIIRLESSRGLLIFEGPEARKRARKIASLNICFMAASTRFHALNELRGRLGHASDHVSRACTPYFRELGELLMELVANAATPDGFERAFIRLTTYGQTLPARFAQTRESFAPNRQSVLDLDTSFELLARFVDDLLAYTTTYSRIVSDSPRDVSAAHTYRPRTNMLLAIVSGVRTFALISALGMLWVETAWPAGGILTLAGATICALASSSPTPARMATQLALGTLLASIAGMFATFGIFPYIDGFPLLCLVLTPFLLFGLYLGAKPRLTGYGVGYCIFFCFLAGPDLSTHYNAGTFINDAIALVLAMFICTFAYAVFIPPATPWLLRRLLAHLRREISVATATPLTSWGNLRARFDSGTRELAHHIATLGEASSDLPVEAVRWLFAVLEVGNAVIDLRMELARLDRANRSAETPPWRIKIQTVIDGLPALFNDPEVPVFEVTLAALTESIESVDAQLDAGNCTGITLTREDNADAMRQVLIQLHFIRTALLDPQSPVHAI